jgi:RNA polymerase sigma-70 factor (family 1)
MGEYQELSDFLLAERFQSGDDAAFKEIYQRYSSLLFLFARKRLYNEDEAMDVVQDVFILILRNREKVALKSSLSSYLYKSVLNKILDIFRHQKIIRKYIEQGSYFIEVDSIESDFLIREKDVRDMIGQEIDAMPPRMMEICRLYHDQNMSAEEISQQLDISKNTVNVQLRRGLIRLKNKFGFLIYVLYIIYKP